MSLFQNDWDFLLRDVTESPFFLSLIKNLNNEEKNYVVYPSRDVRFRAFKETSFADTKVVLCGQEPYCTPNTADGLAYSSMYAPTRALENIFRKIQDELKIEPYIDNYDLTRWAKQGVLLLNTILTVRAGKPSSHTNMDWNRLTYNAIKLLYIDERPKVFILLGQTVGSMAYAMQEENPMHLVLTGPSPDHLRFFYHDYFKRTNDFLLRNYGQTINWR